MLFDELARCSAAVAETASRHRKIELLADVLTRLRADERAPAVAFLVGDTPRGRIGVGWSTIQRATAAAAPVPSLTVDDVVVAVDQLAGAGGAGVGDERRRIISSLLGRATAPEQRLLVAILGGEIRQGALDGVMTAAVARAASVPVDAVRRAAMFGGSLAMAAAAALSGGLPALRAIQLTPLQAVQPMLASPGGTVGEALGDGGAVLVEAKVDGARIQAHRAGGDVRLFTRNLNDVTARLDGVVALVAGLPGGDLVLDGEVIGADDEGMPRPFQDTMADFGADAPGRGGGLGAHFFDVLHVGGTSVVDEPLTARRELLEATVPAGHRLPSIVTGDHADAERFFDEVVARGHEGVVVKRLDAPYDAGRRGAAWRKVKPVRTLDLVVLAVEWGHGRRTGLLSNLHLGARGAPGEFVMVGKTFKGLTDELLRWQTEHFQQLAIGTDGHVVHVRPEQVVEIAVDGVQSSTRYPGGVALRFARVRRYRHDKAPADADTIEAVQSLLAVRR